MLYEDDKILTIEEYQKLAQEYLNATKNNHFKFICSDDNQSLVVDVFNNFALVGRNLFYLGGFLNTGRLYSLTCKQIKSLQEIYNFPIPKVSVPFFDKTKIFLNYLGCESALILSLIKLKECDQNCDLIDKILTDRLILTKNLFQKK